MNASVKGPINGPVDASAKKLTFSLFALYLASAIAGSIMSVVQTNIITEFGLVSAQQGFMDQASRIGMLIALFTIPFLQSKVKRVVMMCFGVALMALNMCIVGFSSGFMALILCLALISFGSCYLDSYVNALIIDLNGEQSTKYVNMLHMAFGIGAMINPFIVNAIRDLMGWRGPYFVVAALMVVMMLIFLFFSKRAMNHPVMKTQKGLRITKKDAVSILKDKRNILTALASTLYSSYQMSIANWIVAYLTLECLVPQDQAVIASSLLWIGVVASRFIISRVRWDPIRTLVIGSFISAPLCMAGILSANFYIICAMTFVCGLLCGHGIPTLTARAGQNNPGRTVMGTSVNSLIGSVVGLIWPTVIGGLQGAFSYRIALLVPGVLLLASAVFSVFLSRACKQHDARIAAEQ